MGVDGSWITEFPYTMAGGNADMGRAEALKLRPSLRWLPLTDILRPYIRYMPHRTPRTPYYVKNTTSSTKPEVHNIVHCCQSRTEPRPHVTCTENFVKFGSVLSRYASWQSDRHTDRHADRITSHPSQWWSNRYVTVNVSLLVVRYGRPM